MNTSLRPPRQRGVALVEFALVSMLFLTLLFGIFEFARLMYVYNTLQEVTRRAAREATVRWIDQKEAVKQIALFDSTVLPAGAEVTVANVKIYYLNAAGNVVSTAPTDAGDNLSACGDALRADSCIYSVKATIEGVTYSPMLSLFGFMNLTMPASTVTMHAESMGFTAY